MLRRPWIEALDLTDEDMVAQCVEISLDSINSIPKYYQTTLPDPIECRVSVHYLVQALLPSQKLSCRARTPCSGS
jgi:hypothetical protein